MERLGFSLVRFAVPHQLLVLPLEEPKLEKRDRALAQCDVVLCMRCVFNNGQKIHTFSTNILLIYQQLTIDLLCTADNRAITPLYVALDKSVC